MKRDKAMKLFYVNNRKDMKNFMGNTLDKPGILVKRNKIGDTEESDEKLIKAGQYR